MSKRKYKRGEVIKSLDELYEHEYFMVQYGGFGPDKTVHAGFVRSWQVQMAKDFISLGRVYAAVRLTNGEFYGVETEDEVVEIAGERLCDFCTLPDDIKEVHCYGVEAVMREGSHCATAAENWLEEYVE